MRYFTAGAPPATLKIKGVGSGGVEGSATRLD